MEEFDSKKDYYEVLGCPDTATIEELKNAHVTLALKYHPDVSQNSNPEHEKKFLAVSEAWSILSKPEVKFKYDLARGVLKREALGMMSAPSTFDYSQSKSNFLHAQKQAPSYWKESQHKYRTESWQRKTLDEKKILRARNLEPLTDVFFGRLGPVILSGVALWAYYQFYLRKKFGLDDFKLESRFKIFPSEKPK